MAAGGDDRGRRLVVVGDEAGGGLVHERALADDEQALAVVGLPHHLFERRLAAGLHRGRHAVAGELEGLRSGAQHARGDLRQLSARVGRGRGNGVAAYVGRAAGPGAEVEGDHVGVVVEDADAVHRHAEPLGGDLGHDRAGAGTGVGDGGDDGHAAVAVHLDDGFGGVLPVVAQAGAGLRQHGHADARARRAFGRSLARPHPLGGALHAGALARAPQVLDAHCHRVQSEPLGHGLQDGLEGEGLLGVSEAPVGGAGRLVGVDQPRVHRRRRVMAVVGREEGHGDEVDGGDALVVVGAVVAEHLQALGADDAVAGAAQPELEAVGVAGAGAAELLVPGVDDAHGPAAGFAGQGRGDGHHDVHHQPGAEAAAGLGLDHAHLPLGDSQGAGDLGAQGVRRLGLVPDRELAGGAVLGDAAAGLHDRVRLARGFELLLHHHVAAREGGLDVALGLVYLVSQVAAVVDLGRIRRQRGLQVQHWLQGFVVHLDEAGCLLGRGLVQGRHRGHFVPGVTHGPPGRAHRDLVRELRNETELDVGHVGRGDNRDHPGQPLGPGGIDAADPGVGQGTAADLAVQHPRRMQVLEVVGLGGDLGGAFDGGRGLADDMELVVFRGLAHDRRIAENRVAFQTGCGIGFVPLEEWSAGP